MKKLFRVGDRQQIAMYLCGCLCFSVGAKFFIDSHLGVDPLDVLVIGLTQRFYITIGFASGAVAIGFLLVWSLWNRKRPPISPFVTMFLVGNLIDLWNYLQIGKFVKPFLASVPMLIVGLVLCSYASALIIMSGIGIRVMDLLAISMVKKWNISFFTAKMIQEVGLFTSGAALGGPFGFATIAFIFVVSPLIPPFMWFNNKLFSLPNHGLGSRRKRIEARG
ncbi:MAG: YczE/YyaS/YitT family protein [Xenococcaceae cyanobacterium]